MKLDLTNLMYSHDELKSRYLVNTGERKDIDNGEKLFRAINEKAEEVREDKKEIKYVITSSAVDRYKEIVDPNGGEKANYDATKKSVFFNHNYNLIVGRSLWEIQEGEKWLAVLQFADSTDFSKDMWNLAKDGYVGMTSIGFIPKALEINALEDIKDLKVTNRSEYDPKMEVWVWRKWELLEWSLVGVGANPDAYEIGKLLQKGLVKSDEAKSYLTNELQRLEIEKAFNEQEKELKSMKALIEEIKAGSGTKEKIGSLEKEIKKLKSKSFMGKAGKPQEYYDALFARAFSKITGRKLK